MVVPVARITYSWRDEDFETQVFDAIDDAELQLDIAEWMALERIVRRSKSPQHAAKLVEWVPGKLTRSSRSFNDRPMRDFAGTLTTALADDSSVWETYATANSSAGDMTRAALSLRANWPEGVSEQLANAMADVESPLLGYLFIWLDLFPPADSVKNDLFPRVAQRFIANQFDPRMRDVVASLVTGKTTHDALNMYTKIHAGNPTLANELFMRVMVKEPLQVLRHCLKMGTPPMSMPDAASDGWLRAVDAACATIIGGASNSTDVKVAAELGGRWGGPRTSAVIKEMASRAEAGSDEAKSWEQAARAIDERITRRGDQQ